MIFKNSLLLILLVSCSLFSPQMDPNITKEVEYINANYGFWKSIKRQVRGMSPDGSVYEAYYEKDEIRKIVESHATHAGYVDYEYYFKNGHLIYSYNIHGTYGQEPKTVHTVDRQYFFQRDQLVQFIDENKKEVSSKSKEFHKAEREILRAGYANYKFFSDTRTCEEWACTTTDQESCSEFKCIE